MKKPRWIFTRILTDKIKSIRLLAVCVITASLIISGDVETFAQCTSYNVGGGGSICPGSSTTVTLSGTQSGVSYQLWGTFGGTNINWQTMTGNGSALTFTGVNNPGNYTIVAVKSWPPSCSLTMSGTAVVTLKSGATAFNVTGGGTICSTSTSSVGLSGSQTGTTYQLKVGSTNVGSPISGTGSSLTWSNLSTAGTYTVVATLTSSGCSATMTGSVSITVNSPPTVSNAGPDQTSTAMCGRTSTTLAANNATSGVGTWSFVSGTGGIISDTSNPTSSFSGTAGATYTLRWTIANSPCPNSTDDVIISFLRYPAIANAGADQTSALTCGNTTVTLSANTASPDTGTWSILTGSGGNIVNLNNATSTFSGAAGATYSLRWTIGNVCSSSYDDVMVTFNQNPTAANAGPDQTGIATCGLTSVQLAGNSPSVGNGNWTVVSGTGGSFANTSLSNTAFSGVAGSSYTLRWTITNGVCISSDNVDVTFNNTFEVCSSINYVTTNSIQQAGILTITQVDPLTSDQKIQSIQYFDGVGRLIQTVATQGSPSKTDIVQAVVYDDNGRESNKYLPFAKESTGWYKRDPIGATPADYATSTQRSFYSNGLSDKIIDDPIPYTQTVFEPSPLNRPQKDYGVGATWAPGSQGGNDKYVYHQYQVNNTNAEQVISWDVSTGIPVRSAVSNSNISSGYYTTGQLNIKSTTDEQGNEVREYVDKLGHTILKKVEAIANASLTDSIGWAQTYYIYDDFGLLRYVFQPRLVSKLIHYNSNPTSADLANYAFIYKYDGRKRMVTKKVPGADSVIMIYDNRDRLILTQDGNQRAGAVTAIKYWTFTKYDQLNRPIMTGIKDTTISTATSEFSRVQMQAVVDAHFAKTSAQWGETFIGTTTAGNIHGYTNKAYPVITGSTAGEKDPNKYLTVTYYDNYTFRNDWPSTYTYASDGLASGAYTQVATGSENNNVIGHPTGTKIKVLDGGVRGGYTWLRGISYYDDKYRVIQTITDNYKGGRDIISKLYDFVGKVLLSKETQTVTTWNNVTATKEVGNKMSKSITGNAWSTSGFSSQQTLPASANGWMEVTIAETNTLKTIGLSQSDPNTNFTSTDFAFYLNASGNLYVCEKCTTAPTTVLSTYAIGDVLRIERSGTTITYYKNNVSVKTTTGATTNALMVDAAFYTANGSFVNVRTNFNSAARAITHTFVYDHAQRLKEQWHQIDTGIPYRTVYNEYNEIGQLVDKKLHSSAANATDFKQSVDYRYNIRGWLTSMNNSQLSSDGSVTNDDPNDYFGMNLLYEQNDSNLGSSGLYNGNISGMKWSNHLGQATIKETGYNFKYDPLNRLLSANARMNSSNVWQSGFYRERSITYDLNGNILKLSRTGDSGNLIDSLTYNYSTFGNQLQYVQDNAPVAANKAKGFIDGHTGTTTDYSYDANGNMTRDLNKGIGNTISDANNLITYNFLNLPDVVTKAGNNVQYIYTAGGQKLAQVVTNVNTRKQTDYVGAYVYENDVLQFINHEEGRVVVSANQLIYSNSFASVTPDLTASGTTLGTSTPTSGETYVTATAPTTGTAAGSGVSAIGGTFNVQPGDRYRIRFKGYRTTHAAYLQVTAGATVLSSPGTALPGNGATYESWIEQIVTIPAATTTMQVGVVWGVAPSASEVLYLNELEITKLTTALPEYQYHLKDHLGNVRLTFTTVTSTDQQTGTYEPENAVAERAKFVRYDNARTVNALIFDHTNISATHGYSERLSASANEKYGIARSISVMPGDVINAEVYAKYVDTNSSNWTSSLATLMSQIASNTSGVVYDGASYSSSTSSFPAAFASLVTKTDDGAPKAYLNWLVFDRNYTFITGGFKQITTICKETGTDVAHEYLSSGNFTITQPGYVYIYLSNESASQVEVYFDDFKVTQTKSPVVQQEDFYPFGLTFNSYSRENSVVNQYQYNSKELQDELGLGWLDYGARMYMPEIGRWGLIDNLTEKMRRWSPYSYAYNNPIVFEDVDGNIPWPKIFGKNRRAAVRQRGFSLTPVPHPIKKKEDGTPLMVAHPAVDLGAAGGTPIRALAQGTAHIGYNNSDGNYVRIDHGNGYVTQYDHIRNNGTLVKEGEEVKDGQEIGQVGQTGSATGPHLHLIMKKDGVPIDPTSIPDLQKEIHPDYVSDDDISPNSDPNIPDWIKGSKMMSMIYWLVTGQEPASTPETSNDQKNKLMAPFLTGGKKLDWGTPEKHKQIERINEF